MDIFEPSRKKGVQIQIKSLDKTEKSMSFTIHNVTVSESFNRVYFLFEQLSKANADLVIKHYKLKEDKVNVEEKIE
jgi:hypothetical protein